MQVNNKQSQKEKMLNVKFIKDCTEERVSPLGETLILTKREYSANSRNEALIFLSTQLIEKKMFYIEVITPNGKIGKDIQGYYQQEENKSVYPLSVCFQFGDYGPFDSFHTAIYRDDPIKSRDHMERVARLCEERIKTYPDGNKKMKLLRIKTERLSMTSHVTIKIVRRYWKTMDCFEEINNGEYFFYRTLANSKDNPLLDNAVSEIMDSLTISKENDSIKEVQHMISEAVLASRLSRSGDYDVIRKKIVVQRSGDTLYELRFDGDIEALLGFKEGLGIDYAFDALLIGCFLDTQAPPFGKG